MKALRSSLNRLVGLSAAQPNVKQSGDVTEITPQHLPPIIRAPVSPWDKLRTISLVSLGLSFVALIVTVSFSNPPNLEKASEAITGVVLRILMAAGALGWATSGIFSKRKGTGTLVFSSVAAAALFGFSIFLCSSIIKSRRTKISDRAWASNARSGLDKFISHAQNGELGDGAPIANTGDIANDELSNALNKFMTDVGNLIVGMKGEFDALHPLQIFDDTIITAPAVLDAETQKRVQGLQIIERYHQKMGEIPDHSRIAFAAMNVSEDEKKSAMRGLDVTWQKQQPQVDRLFELLKAQQQTELDYLRFLAAWSGSYQFQNGKITFLAKGGAEQYNLLTKSITDTSSALVVFREDQLKKTQEGKDRLSDIGK